VPLQICFSLLFFFSGATSLILQIAWTKELSYVLGNSLYSVSTVVAAFMAGLGLGSYFFARNWKSKFSELKLYIILQFIICAYALISIPLLRSSDAIIQLLYTAESSTSINFLLFRFLVVFLLILVPATLMGATLPALTHYFSQNQKLRDGATALFYGLNTVGAACGVLLAGFFLIPTFGLQKTTVIAAAIDFLIAVFGIAALNGKRRQAPFCDSATLKNASLNFHQRGLLFLYFCVGFLLIGAEVYWYRILSNILGPFEQCYSIILSLFLFGIGSGSYFYSLGEKRFGKSKLLLPLASAAIFLGFISSLYILPILPELYGSLFVLFKLNYSASILAQAITAAILVVPVTFASGFLFPSFVRAFSESVQNKWNSAQIVGSVYTVNTLGSILGSLVVGFYLLPKYGLNNTLLLFMILAAVLLCAFAINSVRRKTFANSSAILAVFVLAVFWILHLPKLDRLMLNRGAYMVMADPELMFSTFSDTYDKNRRVLFYEDGLLSSVMVEEIGKNRYLRIAGKPEAGSRDRLRSHHVLLAQLPLSLAKNIEDVAVVGLGAGFTAGSILENKSVRSLDVLEIEASVVPASRFFGELSKFSDSDSRVKIILEDARTHFKYSQKQYDIITSDPVSPVFAGCSNLYTEEYYQLVKDRLKDGGVFGQWIDSSFISESTFKSILKTVQNVFGETMLFVAGDELMVIASKSDARYSWPTIATRYSHKIETLTPLGINSPELLFESFLGSRESLSAYLEGTHHVNTDDDNWLGQEVTKDLMSARYNNGLVARLYENFSASVPAEMRTVFSEFPYEKFENSVRNADLPIFAAYKETFLKKQH
jgi:spermidine synthase